MSFLINSKSPALLKSYIDARFLIIRLEKLKKIASGRILDAEEAAELSECVNIFASGRLNGTEIVSERQNKDLSEQAKSLIQAVQRLENSRQQLATVQASRKAIADGNAALVRRDEHERVRKAEVKRNADNVGEVITWARWKKPDDGKYFYQNLLTNEVTWTLPAGTDFIDAETRVRHKHDDSLWM